MYCPPPADFVPRFSDTFLLLPLEITGLHTEIAGRNSVVCIMQKVATWSFSTLKPMKKIKHFAAL